MIRIADRGSRDELDDDAPRTKSELREYARTLTDDELETCKEQDSVYEDEIYRRECMAEEERSL